MHEVTVALACRWGQHSLNATWCVLKIVTGNCKWVFLLVAPPCYKAMICYDGRRRIKLWLYLPPWEWRGLKHGWSSILGGEWRWIYFVSYIIEESIRLNIQMVYIWLKCPFLSNYVYLSFYFWWITLLFDQMIKLYLSLIRFMSYQVFKYLCHLYILQSYQAEFVAAKLASSSWLVHLYLFSK